MSAPDVYPGPGEPGYVPGRIGRKPAAPADADWRAMRDWLIKTRADAQQFAGSSRGYADIQAGFQAQAEVLSSALDFMDERERAYLPGRQESAEGITGMQWDNLGHGGAE